jgi:hypothetical protein
MIAAATGWDAVIVIASILGLLAWAVIRRWRPL